MNLAHTSDYESAFSMEALEREKAVRIWIARKESVCPYAPGLAKFVHLPRIESMDREHVYCLADALEAFYTAKEQGKRVGRWMLMPHQEWGSHEEAHRYAERLFWLLNAAYYHLRGKRKLVGLALKREISGYNRGIKGEILNPIIGDLPDLRAKSVPAKSLFYSALSPLYRSRKFYRYSPASIIPLVYASEFQALKCKHPNVTEGVAFEMALGGLYESLGEGLAFSVERFRKELPVWGAMIDRIAELMRASATGYSSMSSEVKGCPESNLQYFRVCQPKLVSAFYNKYKKNLPILAELMSQTGAEAKMVISACFAGSGLYTLPDYQ